LVFKHPETLVLQPTHNTPAHTMFATLLDPAHNVQEKSKKELIMEMIIKRACLGEELSAFILVVKNYQKKGYLSDFLTWKGFSAIVMRCMAHIWKIFSFRNNQKGCIIIAKEHDRVIGTVTVEFNPTHTPIDCLFPVELALIRESSFVYIGSFAVASTHHCTRLSLRMLRHLWSLIQERTVEQGVCVVNPDHCKFYERFGFHTVSISEEMPGLSCAPAALMVIHRHEVML